MRKSKSKSRSNSKSPRKNSAQKTQVYNEEEIDDILENINLKRPRNMYTHFCLEQIDEFRRKNKGKKIDMKVFSGECASKWKKLSEKDQEKYKDLFEKDKLRFKKDLQVVSHYLFKDYNDIVRRPPTAYRIYLNEKLREGFEKDLDPKEVKSKASRDWRQMPDEKRQVYQDRKKENDNWFEKAKNTRKVTPLSMFVQNHIQNAKDKKEQVPTLAEVAAMWKKTSSSEKEKYQKYAEEINEERQKLQDIYEIINGVKPKKPAGAFRVFLQERAKEKAFKNLNEGKELWDKLSKEEKDEYLKKAHKCKLAYKYKNMIYKKKIRKMLPKKPANAFAQFIKEKKGQKIPAGKTPGEYWKDDWDKLSEAKKEKYEEKAHKEKERYEKKMEEFKNYVFDIPKRPLNAFSLYVRDRIPEIKKDRKDEPVPKLLKIVAKEWNNEDGVSQSKYEKKAEQDKKRFLRQMKDFEKLGYYKKNSRGERTKGEDDDEEEEKKSKKKRRGSSTASKSSKKSSKKTKSKSKSKTQDSKKKRSASKNKKKSGKTQKKK